MIDPVSLVIGGALVAAGWLAGRVSRKPPGATQPETVCSCDHGYGSHADGKAPSVDRTRGTARGTDVSEPIDDVEVIPTTRAMLFAGMLVGIGDEHHDPPSDLQLGRATDLINRASRRRFGHPVTRDDLITVVNDIQWRYPNDVPSLVDALLMYYRIEGKTLEPQTLEIKYRD